MRIVVGGRQRVLARLVAARVLVVITLVVVALVVVALVGGLSLASADQGWSRDPSFGTGGRVVVADVVTSGGSGIYDVQTQDDGSVLIAIRSDISEIRRHLATGEADADFGVGGTLPVEGDRKIISWWWSRDIADPIVVVLSTPTEGTYALRRYTANGQVDSSFGTAGEVTVAFGTGRGRPGLAVSSGGTITVSASRSDWTFPSTIIHRFRSTGAVDVGFGDAGVGAFDDLVVWPVGADADAAVMFEHTDPLTGRVSIVRVTASGLLDTTYGTAGFAELRGNLMFTDAVVAGSGAVTAVSRHYGSGTVGYVVRAERLDASGAPDGTFGNGGITDLGFLHLQPNVSNNADFAWPRSVVDLGDGRVGVLLNSFSSSAAAVFRADGAPDPEFGQGGRAILSTNFQLLAGSMSPDGTVDFLGGVGNTKPVYLQRSIGGSPWPPVSPAPTGLSAWSALDGAGNWGFQASWTHAADPDPEVDDDGYVMEVSWGDEVIRTDVVGAFAELYGFEHGVYTVTVRSRNMYGVGLPASTTVTLTVPPLDSGALPREHDFSRAVRLACEPSAHPPLMCQRPQPG